ncbi:MAG: TIGR00730 family Rossman fold protein [Alphaproteobacteria bacterium]
MRVISSLCIYCGSSKPQPRHQEQADALADILVRHGIDMVYGGARAGLMGFTADAVLSRGGRVIGIIPEYLDKYEIGHTGVTKLHIVANMHVRKMMMFDSSDAFLVFPGGYGTMDEMFEMLTWRQLAMHDKPIIVVNVDGYWDPLVTLLEHIVQQGYAKPETKNLLHIIPDVSQMMGLFKTMSPPDPSPPKVWLQA